MRWLSAAAGAGIAGWTAPALAPLIPALCNTLGVRRRLSGHGPAVALTFDDGPHPEGTPAILEILAAAEAKATFFMVGEQVERRPGLAAAVTAAGHTVGLHGQCHRNQLRLAPRTLDSDTARGIAVLEEVTGTRPTLYRPPYGIFSPTGLALVGRRSLAPWLWSRWGRDWRRTATPRSIAAKATQELGAGDVLLLHDADFYSAPGSWKRTAQALPLILDAIAERGLRAVPL